MDEELERFHNLGHRAALGDEAALMEVQDCLGADGERARLSACEIISAIRGDLPATEGLWAKLHTLGQQLMELGARDIAEVFRLLAEEGSQRSREFGHSDEIIIEIDSEKERSYRLLQLGNELKVESIARECVSGRLPCRLRINKNVCYVLLVATEAYEPRIQIPIFVPSSGPSIENITIDLAGWEGLGSRFLWIPNLQCVIGGDLAARDPLPTMPVQVGPLAVHRFHCSMADYLAALELHGRASLENECIPMYMGRPLVKYSSGKWQSMGINVRSGHNWLEAPVVGIDFDNAQWYCANYQVANHLSCDLLREDEWETLARGPDSRLFPWGNVFVPGLANIRTARTVLDSGLETVGYRKTDCSAFGVFDCSGNAEEWCWPMRQVKLDEGEGFAIARGGSWYNPGQASRLASRVVRHRDYRHKKLTFRVAARLKE